MTVQVIHGANEGLFEFNGRTVQQVAKTLREVFNVPENAEPFVNGHKANRSTLLKDGDTLEFVQEFGRKGGLHDFWSERELVDFFGADEVQKMREAGMKTTSQPVLAAEEVVRWGQWLRDQDQDPSRIAPVNVDIENESLTFRGREYEIDQQMAAVMQCLINARGHRCSAREMKKKFPQFIMDERLDLTIKRKLKTHPSGIGDHIQSDRKGYWLVVPHGE